MGTPTSMHSFLRELSWRCRRSSLVIWVSGEADYFLEVVVQSWRTNQHFLVGKLLTLPIVREVRSNIAIQTLKAGAPLPLDHLE
jgi:Lrp/AsnC ligand binding domain